MNYKLYTIFFAILGLGIIALYCISAGYYPIAIVNGNIITAKTFINDYGVASVYYQSLLKAYENSSSTSQTLTQVQIQQDVLSGIIENILIDNGAREEMGKDIDRLVGEKVSEATAIQGIEKAARTVYGLSLDDFKKKILVPQAERDILTGSLFLKGQKMEDWLVAKKKSSTIIILSGKFYWDGENVASK